MTVYYFNSTQSEIHTHVQRILAFYKMIKIQTFISCLMLLKYIMILLHYVLLQFFSILNYIAKYIDLHIYLSLLLFRTIIFCMYNTVSSRARSLNHQQSNESFRPSEYSDVNPYRWEIQHRLESLVSCFVLRY